MKDSLLVLQCKNGDTDALHTIYNRYRDYLIVLAVALCHDINLAEDALHDVFVGFAERIGQFELTGSLKAYLATCVVNRIRDQLKRKDRNTMSLTNNCFVSSSQGEPQQRIVCNEQLQRLASAMAKLPIEQKEVIALHIHAQMSMSAISRSLGASVNTIKGRYRYGIAKLRSSLEQEVEK